MSKGLKIGLGVGLVVLLLVVLYFVFRSNDTWAEYPNKDVVPGPNIEERPSGSLEDDKAHAKSIGAVSFFRLGGTTWFKSAKAPITASSQGSGTLYVKQ